MLPQKSFLVMPHKIFFSIFVKLCMGLSAKFALRVRRSCVSRAPIGMLVYCHLQMDHPVFFIELLTEFYFRLRDMVSQPERYFLRLQPITINKAMKGKGAHKNTAWAGN